MDTLNLVIAYLALTLTAAPIYFYFLWQKLGFWQKKNPVWNYFTGLGIVILVLVFFGFTQSSWQSATIDFTSWAKIVGWILIIFSSIIFAIAQIQMGLANRAFISHLKAGKVDLIQIGLYAIVRHPMYSVLPLFIFGAFLATGYAIVLIPFMILASTVNYFASWEEEAMIVMLGDAYRAYQKQVPKFIPKIKR